MKGSITQIIGPVVDVRFEGELPSIKNALVLEVSPSTSLDSLRQSSGQAARDKSLGAKTTRKVVFEVAQHLGVNRVRAIAMSDTNGLTRRMEVKDTGGPISVPVGEQSLGRLFNVLGDAIDGKEQLKGERSSIHRDPPPFTEQKTKAEVFETGLKAIDL